MKKIFVAATHKRVVLVVTDRDGKMSTISLERREALQVAETIMSLPALERTEDGDNDDDPDLSSIAKELLTAKALYPHFGPTDPVGTVVITNEKLN